MKPSSTASVPQRPRRSAVECTPPKLVASATSSQRGEEALRALRALQREADERAGERHLARGAPPGRVARRRDVARSRRSRPRRPRSRSSAPGGGQRGQRAVREPGLERRPRSRPTGCAAPQRLSPGGIGDGDRAEQDVGVPGQALVPESIASAPNASGRWPSGVQTVLSTASSAPAACAAAATAAMSTTSSRGFDGDSIHTSAAPSARRGDRGGVGGTSRVSTPRGASRSSARPRTPG